jgi:hypothetical protein
MVCASIYAQAVRPAIHVCLCQPVLLLMADPVKHLS